MSGRVALPADFLLFRLERIEETEGFLPFSGLSELSLPGVGEFENIKGKA